MTRRMTVDELREHGIPEDQTVEVQDEMTPTQLAAAIALAKTGVKVSYGGYDLMVEPRQLMEARAIATAAPAQQRLTIRTSLHKTLASFVKRRRRGRPLGKKAHDDFVHDVLLWTALTELDN